MKCENCNSEISNENNFCPYCGSKVHYKCPNCGKEVKDNSLFCSNCGNNLITGENKIVTPQNSKNELLPDSRDKYFAFNLILCIFALMTIVVTFICLFFTPILEIKTQSYFGYKNVKIELLESTTLKLYFNDLIQIEKPDFPEFSSGFTSAFATLTFIFYIGVYSVFAILTIVFCIKYIVQKVKLNTHTILGVVISNIFLPFGLSICVSEFIIQPQTNGVFYNFSIQFAYGLNIIIFFSITLFALIGVSKMLIKTSVEYAAVKEFNLICSLLFILIPIFTIRNQYMITANIIANYKFSFSSFFIVDAMLSYGKSSISSELYPILVVSTILKISLTFVLIGLLLNARTRKRRIILSILLLFAFIFHLVPNILINYFFNMYKQNVTTIYLTPSTEFDINLSNFNFSANTPYIFATVILLTVLILNLISLPFPRIKSEEFIENDLVTQ